MFAFLNWFLQKEDQSRGEDFDKRGGDGERSDITFPRKGDPFPSEN